MKKARTAVIEVNKVGCIFDKKKWASTFDYPIDMTDTEFKKEHSINIETSLEHSPQSEGENGCGDEEFIADRVIAIYDGKPSTDFRELLLDYIIKDYLMFKDDGRIKEMSHLSGGRTVVDLLEPIMMNKDDDMSFNIWLISSYFRHLTTSKVEQVRQIFSEKITKVEFEQILQNLTLWDVSFIASICPSLCQIKNCQSSHFSGSGDSDPTPPQGEPSSDPQYQLPQSHLFRYWKNNYDYRSYYRWWSGGKNDYEVEIDDNNDWNAYSDYFYQHNYHWDASRDGFQESLKVLPFDRFLFNREIDFAWGSAPDVGECLGSDESFQIPLLKYDDFVVFFNKVTENFFIEHPFDYFCSVQGEFLFLTMRGITPPQTVPLVIFFSFSTTGEELPQINITEFTKKCSGNKWDDVLIHKDSRLNTYECFYPNFPYKITIVQTFQEQLSCEQCRFIICPKTFTSSTSSTSPNSTSTVPYVSPDAPPDALPDAQPDALPPYQLSQSRVNNLILYTYPYLQYLKTGFISIISDVCSERKCLSYVKPGFCKGLFGSSKFVTFLHYNSISKLHTINFEYTSPITSKNMFQVLSGDVRGAGANKCASHSLLYQRRVFDRDKHREFKSGGGGDTFEYFVSAQEREKTEPVISIIDTADLQTGVAIKYVGYGMFRHYISMVASSAVHDEHARDARINDRTGSIRNEYGRRAMIEADMADIRAMRDNEVHERGDYMIPFAITTPNPSIQAPQNPTRDANGRVIRPPTYGLSRNVNSRNVNSRTSTNNRRVGQNNVYNGAGDTVGGGGRGGEIGTIVLFRLRRDTYHVLIGVMKDVTLPHYPEDALCCSEDADAEDNIYAHSHKGRYSGGNLSNGEWKIVGSVNSTFEELQKRYKEIEKQLL